MHNVNIPTEVELPSSRRLFVSSLLALVVAAVILVTVILPAEYGIDPTGVGRAIGLQQMGEIKMQLADEARLEDAQSVQPESAPEAPAPALETAAVEETVVATTETTTAEVEVESLPATPAPEVEVESPPAIPEPTVNSETLSVTIKPGAAAEIKVALKQAQAVSYRWTVDTGHVNYDTHGDNDSIKYHNYNKGKAKTSDEDQLVAAFDGSHGWFWRNRSDEVVTVTITVTGEFEKLKRVL